MIKDLAYYFRTGKDYFFDLSAKRNLFSFYFLQLANYIIPFLIIPYLVRVLGPQNFGKISFTISFLNLFVELTNFGFHWSGVRDISFNRENNDRLSIEASSILFARIILFIISFFLIFFSTQVNQKLFESRFLILILIGTVLGNSLFPFWVFQGLEKMYYISFLNVGVRLVSLVLIFALVKDQEDYVTYATILSVQSLVIGLLGLSIVYFRMNINIWYFSLISAFQKIKDSFYLFLAQIFHYLYTNVNEFILGLLSNYKEVGIYSGAYKIAIVFTALLGPIVQVYFPRFSYLIQKKFNEKVLITFLLLNFTIGFILTVILFLTSEYLVKIFLGINFQESIYVLKLLSFLPLIISLPYSLTASVIMPMKADKKYLLILFIASLLNLILATILVPKFHAKGMAISYLICELFVCLSILSLSYKLIKKEKKYEVNYNPTIFT